MKQILIAPVQGSTDAAWRHFHKDTYNFEGEYTTPFIRLEHGELRKKDSSDLFSELNNPLPAAQIIFKDAAELNTLVDLLHVKKINRIDLNMGCPFPLQTARGRGAASIANIELASAVKNVIENNPEIDFSVKMRLGMQQSDEWRNLISTLNTVNVSHITVHPRVARQQYGGEVDLQQFRAILENSTNPVIYNGDLNTPQQIDDILTQFPDIAGVMLGRGVLGRPSLATEFLSGEEWDKDTRLEYMLKFHNKLFGHYSSTLIGGEHQVLSKIQPFWLYAENEIGRKAWKGIKKASTMPKYNTALALVEI